MHQFRLLPAIALSAAACSPAAPRVDTAAPAPPAPAVPIGPGTIEGWGVERDVAALCVRADPPRLVVVDLAALQAATLPWPFDPAERCERLAPGGGLVCAAGYDAGVACLPSDGSAPPVRPRVDGPPTGLAWDGTAFWVGTDGAGLWRVVPGADPERVFESPDLMSGLAAGAFGVVWGTGGEYSWRTRILRQGAAEPEWIRPPPPPNVVCAEEREVCEWVSTALGVYRGRVYFAAVNAPAPLYAMALGDGRWEETRAPGEVVVGRRGVWAVRADGVVERYDAAARLFRETNATVGPGGAAIPADSGLWIAGAGAIRLAVPTSPLLPSSASGPAN